MKYIKTMNEGVDPKVGKTLLLPKDLFNHKHINEYDPFAINQHSTLNFLFFHLQSLFKTIIDTS